MDQGRRTSSAPNSLHPCTQTALMIAEPTAHGSQQQQQTTITTTTTTSTTQSLTRLISNQSTDRPQSLSTISCRRRCHFLNVGKEGLPFRKSTKSKSMAELFESVKYVAGFPPVLLLLLNDFARSRLLVRLQRLRRIWPSQAKPRWLPRSNTPFSQHASQHRSSILSTLERESSRQDVYIHS